MITCPKCEMEWPEGDYHGEAFIFLGLPECSFIELRCQVDGCDGARRRFVEPGTIEGVCEHFDIALHYEATPPYEVMGAFYYQYRRENRVIFGRPDADD